MKKQRLTTLLFLLFTTIVVSAQPAERMLQVLVAPNHSNCLYKEGEKVKFTITVLKNNVPMENVEIRYEISEDMMKPHKTESLVLKNGINVIDAGTMKKSGFLRCRAFTKYNNVEYQGIATVGFTPENIKPVAKLPADFVEFWNNAKAEAAKVPMDVKMTLVPDKCTEKVDVYLVNIQNYQPGARLYGVLCVPKKEGKYPAILKVPGAGVRGYNGDIENASKGYIIFEIGIHGIPVNLPAEVYTSLAAGALKNYNSFNLDNRDNYYYKRVYLGCVRAVDFIYTLPQFNGDVISYGGSQGGALAIVSAALDDRIKGLVSFYPALCDVTGYLHNRAGGWPHMFRQPENNTNDKINTAQYYDVVNFARQLRVPGLYTFGYNDMVCAPTTVYSAVNMITAPKDVYIVEKTAHYAYPEQRQMTWKWVDDFFRK